MGQTGIWTQLPDSPIRAAIPYSNVSLLLYFNTNIISKLESGNIYQTYINIYFNANKEVPQ